MLYTKGKKEDFHIDVSMWFLYISFKPFGNAFHLHSFSKYMMRSGTNHFTLVQVKDLFSG